MPGKHETKYGKEKMGAFGANPKLNQKIPGAPSQIKDPGKTTVVIDQKGSAKVATLTDYFNEKYAAIDPHVITTLAVTAPAALIAFLQSGIKMPKKPLLRIKHMLRRIKRGDL